MVKRQKEKQYQSARENRSNQQLRSGKNSNSNSNTNHETSEAILPFSHCALTLVPYETPVCNSLGIIFDQNALMKFIFRHKMDPVTGTAVTNYTKDGNYIRLHMDQNEEGKWQCPILTKPFNDRTKVVAIIQRLSKSEEKGSTDCDASKSLKEANVYSYEAYYELNVKPKNYEDLISGQTFHPKNDVIIIYDPNDTEFNRRRSINTFYHILHSNQLNDTSTIDSLSSVNTSNTNVRHSVTATRVMETFRKKQIKDQQEEQKRQQNEDKKRKVDAMLNGNSNMGNTIYFCSRTGQPLQLLASDVTGAQHTIGRGGASSSLTSTAASVSDTNLVRNATDEEITTAQCNVMRNQFKNMKGYVKLHTNYGAITIELHCDIVPRTCINFLGLCRHHKYNDTVFHRLIPKFMIQGGGYNTQQASDGSHTEKHREESSIWGKPFDDEFDHRLQHNSAGIVSMANSGPNTNQQQFFITFQSCSHLDQKHNVFGVVVDGLDILKEWENIPVKKKDCPSTEIKIVRTEILVDPAMKAYEYEQKRIEQLILRRDANANITDGTVMQPMLPLVEQSSIAPPQVGQYLPPHQTPDQLTIAKTDPRNKRIVAVTNTNVDDNRRNSAVKLSTASTTVASTNIDQNKITKNTKPITKFGNFSGW